jgi:hypothetical protein
MSKKLKETKGEKKAEKKKKPSNPVVGVSEVLRSNEELNEIIEDVKAKVKEVDFKERKASIDLYSEIGRQASKARRIVEENDVKWSDYTKEVFNKSRYRVDESIALYRAIKKYRKKDKEKAIAIWMCKSNLEKAGQMLESEDDDTATASEKLLENGDIMIAGVVQKAEKQKPMDVLNALKELTKGEDKKSENEFNDELKKHIKSLRQIDDYVVTLRRSASGVNGDFDRARIQELNNLLDDIVEHCKELLEEMEECDDDE